jgi:hypothetical protein
VGRQPVSQCEGSGASGACAFLLSGITVDVVWNILAGRWPGLSPLRITYSFEGGLLKLRSGRAFDLWLSADRPPIKRAAGSLPQPHHNADRWPSPRSRERRLRSSRRLVQDQGVPVRDFVARFDLKGGENRSRSVEYDLPAQVVLNQLPDLCAGQRMRNSAMPAALLPTLRLSSGQFEMVDTVPRRPPVNARNIRPNSL